METEKFNWITDSTLGDLYNYESVIDTTHSKPNLETPLRLGFNIDDVVRDTSKRIFWFYVKDYLTNYGIVPSLNYEDVDLGDLSNSLGFKKESKLPIEDKYDEIVDANEVVDKKTAFEYEKFIQDNYLDIFGNSTEVYKGASTDLNNLFEFLKEENIKPVIIQREGGIIRNATFLFLSDKGISIDQVNFIKNYEDAFDYCDILVTANPNFLKIGSKNNIIKLNTHYNKDIETTYEINKINDMFDLVNKIKK